MNTGFMVGTVLTIVLALFIITAVIGLAVLIRMKRRRKGWSISGGSIVATNRALSKRNYMIKG